MPMERLMFFMNRAGYQVYLSESTRDSNLDDQSPIRLALHNASIDENLRFARMPSSATTRFSIGNHRNCIAG